MRWTAEKIGLSDTFFLKRSTEKRYEFIRYTETYQFTQLHKPLSASPQARQRVQGNVAGENFVERL